MEIKPIIVDIDVVPITETIEITANPINIDLITDAIPMKGDRGEQGVKGDRGEQGVSGLSAYQIAVNNGFVGTEQEWLQDLKSIEWNSSNW